MGTYPPSQTDLAAWACVLPDSNTPARYRFSSEVTNLLPTSSYCKYLNHASFIAVDYMALEIMISSAGHNRTAGPANLGMTIPRPGNQKG